jgi:hypothetical protein
MRSTTLSGDSQRTPGIGHTRQDLTDQPVKFWSVYSYLVVYDPESRPLTIVAVLHGAAGRRASAENVSEATLV